MRLTSSEYADLMMRDLMDQPLTTRERYALMDYEERVINGGYQDWCESIADDFIDDDDDDE